jgi:hypothetical protein
MKTLDINGDPVRLLGTNRHDARLTKGRALSSSDMRDDIQTFRRANINVIRTSHYPPAPEFLDICDELGMYVDEEAPICWAGESKPLFGDMTHVDAHALPYLWQLIAETFERDRNHPSVVVWDIANESTWGPNFAACLRRLRERDGSRVTVFSLDANAEDEPDGSMSTATRVAVGTSSRKSSSRFVPNSALKILIPVRLPPGRARLATRPSLTGSSAARKTMGIVVVVAFAANAEVGPPVAAITATCRRTKSAANAGSRSI